MQAYLVSKPKNSLLSDASCSSVFAHCHLPKYLAPLGHLWLVGLLYRFHSGERHCASAGCGKCCIPCRAKTNPMPNTLRHVLSAHSPTPFSSRTFFFSKKPGKLQKSIWLKLARLCLQVVLQFYFGLPWPCQVA